MESYTIESNRKKSRVPARLDVFQSGTGLVLGLFVWGHIVLNASIILGPGAFNWVSQNVALSFLSSTGHGYPIAVFFAVCVLFTLFAGHALLSIRKFPVSWKQHRIIKDQMAMMKHQDTNLWYIQVLTGFIMFFAGSVHLYHMLTHPGSIDPYLGADRVVFHNMWLVYLILLVCVVLHGNIGFYRLCMKWGWFQGADPQRAREKRAKLKKLRNKLMIIFLAAGLLTLLVFVIIGLRHKDGQSHQATRPPEPHGAEPAAVEPFYKKQPWTETVHGQAPSPPEETVIHDSPPGVPKSESVHETAMDDPGDVLEEVHKEVHEDIQKDDAPHQATPAVQPHEAAPPAVETFHDAQPGAETVHEQVSPPVEATVTHDGPPAVQGAQPAHEDAVDVPDDVQKEVHEKVHEEIHEDATGDDDAVHGDAGPPEAEAHTVQGEVHPTTEGGHGPQETL